ncbi:MAG: transcription elongation factor GreA [Desulfobacteraceae bacterium 4572_130]|nr:MAG: transcription elongation factor GreA [Desulfobacteraceae bacterium 4572_130]
MKQIPITVQGFETLKKTLKQLKTVDRPRNIKAIETARAHGDLSENAEFDAAKERQSFIEGKINGLEYKIANARVIDPDTLSKDDIRFASRVILENLDSGETVKYMLVGQEESDINDGKISVSSPLGRALIGKKPGDEVVLQAPGGKRIYEVMDIL